MKVYAGIELNSNNNYPAIIDEQIKRLYQKRLPHQPDVIPAELAPFQKLISGIVVESTFNRCWLIDTLMDNGCKTHLAIRPRFRNTRGSNTVTTVIMPSGWPIFSG
jgi:transposase